ncbi:MAG: lytic transglycosylase domain-containing protein [Deltaproteobacteria bacterium]|nr:lytic transglycosylase domain-containing protein [Deltaproteobacteria bacterium]
MTISPSELFRRIGSGDPLKESSATTRSRGGAAFTDLLASAGKAGDTASGNSANAAAEAEIIRLRMMRNAISLQTDDQDSAPAGSIPATDQLLHRLASYQEYLTPQRSSFDNPDPDCSPEPAGPSPSSARECPMPLEDIIHRASRRYDVDPGLVRAVIRAESNFNPSAVSSAGARGLMQLMPGTARGLGVTDSFDPEQNVMAGTRYLRQMLNRYDGDLDSALAAYNWGPGNVDRRGGSLPRETRNYLSTVKGYYSGSAG